MNSINITYLSDNKHKISINDIIEGKQTAVLISGAIEDTVRVKLMSALEKLKTIFFRDLNAGNGYSVPTMFGQLYNVKNSLEIHEYYSKVPSFLNEVNNSTGINISEYIDKLLSQYFQPYKVEILPGFLPFSIRVLYPGKGGLHIHRDEDLFPYIDKLINSKIQELILPETFMSWFITLEEAEAGGKIRIAHPIFCNYKKINDYSFEHVENKTRISLEDIKGLEVETPKGSLFLFNGGDFWHSITSVSGVRERVTLGGFMALSIDKSLMYYWS
jgi:hypothetical protein